MHCTPKQLVLITLLALAPGLAQAERAADRLHLAGLGLQSGAGAAALTSDLAFGGEAAQVWQANRSSDYSLYTGERETARLGLRAAESYGGLVYSPRGGWGSSLEAGYAPESALSPRRYALTGQLHTAFSETRSFSVGLKYRVQDTDAALRYGMITDPTQANGYSLAPPRYAGAGLVSSYQLQMSYQHSAASSFGVALGREVETYTPIQDVTGSGPRQFSFTGQHWVTPSWALSYDVLSQDAITPLRSLGLRLGVRYRW